MGELSAHSESSSISRITSAVIASSFSLSAIFWSSRNFSKRSIGSLCFFQYSTALRECTLIVVFGVARATIGFGFDQNRARARARIIDRLFVTS
jgi:hypothetical protein